MKTTALKALRTLGDDELSTVSGAHGRGHAYGKYKHLLPWYGSLTNTQSNVTGPIVQIAIGNSGPVTQAVGVSQSNSASF